MKKATALALFLFLICGLIVPNISIKAHAENVAAARTVQADLEKNLKVNAAVDAPEITGLSLSVVRAQLLPVDGQQVYQVLFPDTAIIDTPTYSDSTDAQHFELDGEKYIATSTGFVNVTTPLGEIVTQLYALEWILNDASLQQPDLAFASRAEVIQQTLDVLSEIGIKNVQCAEAYALTTEALQNASDDLMSEPESAEDIREGRIACKDNWTIDDECYVLEMQFVVGDEGLPVFSNPTPKAYAFTEIHYENYSFEVVVSKDGIISLRVFSAFEELDPARTGAILPVEDVVDLIAAYYRNIIIEYPTEIREILLRYILLPVEGENSYELTPAWCCQAVSQYGSKDECETSWIVFDAITGQVHY